MDSERTWIMLSFTDTRIVRYGISQKTGDPILFQILVKDKGEATYLVQEFELTSAELRGINQ